MKSSVADRLSEEELLAQVSRRPLSNRSFTDSHVDVVCSILFIPWSSPDTPTER
jgi:hypothetical protein